MAGDPKGSDSKVSEERAEVGVTEAQDSPDDDAPEAHNGDQNAPHGASKKKKSKAKKIKNMMTGKSSEDSPGTTSVTDEQFKQLLALNPALKSDVATMDPAKVQEMMKNLDLREALSGMV
jgi:glycylpeptide N-tetradecanoyltransferase